MNREQVNGRSPRRWRPLSPVTSHALAYAASAAVQKGVGFALFLWLAHSLSVAEYATFGLLFALVTGLAALAGGGIVEAATSLLAGHRTREAQRTLFSAANAVFLGFAAASAVIVASASSWIVQITKGSAFDVLCVAAAGICSAFFVMQSHLVRLGEDHRASLWLGFVPPLAGWAFAIAAYALIPTISSLFAGLAMGLCLSLVPFRMAGLGVYAASAHAVRPVLLRVGPYLAITMLAWLAGYGNSYSVELLFTSADVARYTFAYTLASIMQLVATSLNQAWGPRCLRSIRELPREQVEALNQKFFAWHGLVIGAIGALVLALLPGAIRLVGSSMSHYQGLELELFLLFAGYAMSIPWYHVQYYYFADDRGVQLLRLTLACTLAGMTAWFACMWLLGPIGVYVGALLFMSVKSLGTFAWARREWGVRVLWHGPVAALILLAAGSVSSRVVIGYLPIP